MQTTRRTYAVQLGAHRTTWYHVYPLDRPTEDEALFKAELALLEPRESHTRPAPAHTPYVIIDPRNPFAPPAHMTAITQQDRDAQFRDKQQQKIDGIECKVRRENGAQGLIDFKRQREASKRERQARKEQRERRKQERFLQAVVSDAVKKHRHKEFMTDMLIASIKGLAQAASEQTVMSGRFIRQVKSEWDTYERLAKADIPKVDITTAKGVITFEKQGDTIIFYIGIIQ